MVDKPDFMEFLKPILDLLQRIDKEKKEKEAQAIRNGSITVYKALSDILHSKANLINLIKAYESAISMGSELIEAYKTVIGKFGSFNVSANNGIPQPIIPYLEEKMRDLMKLETQHLWSVKRLMSTKGLSTEIEAFATKRINSKKHRDYFEVVNVWCDFYDEEIRQKEKVMKSFLSSHSDLDSVNAEEWIELSRIMDSYTPPSQERLAELQHRYMDEFRESLNRITESAESDIDPEIKGLTDALFESEELDIEELEIDSEELDSIEDIEEEERREKIWADMSYEDKALLRELHCKEQHTVNCANCEYWEGKDPNSEDMCRDDVWTVVKEHPVKERLYKCPCFRELTE